MAKLLKYNEEGRAAILKGVNQLANAVKVTRGPKEGEEGPRRGCAERDPRGR